MEHARPLLVKLLVGWLHHDGRYVAWNRIRSIEPDRIMTFRLSRRLAGAWTIGLRLHLWRSVLSEC